MIGITSRQLRAKFQVGWAIIIIIYGGKTMHKAECNLSLDELLKLDGVVAAGMFSPEGKLVDYKDKMNMPVDMAQMTAKFCGTVNMMFEALASAYTQLYKMNWVPQHSWMYSGGEWTVIIAGQRGVFVESSKADFVKLLKALGLC